MKEKLWKNRYGLLIVFMLLAAAVHYFFFYEKCEQPSKAEMYDAQLTCLINTDVNEIREAACQKLYGTSVCEFQPEDRETVLGVLAKKINDCAKAALVRNNKCIDKYEEIQ